VFLKRHTIQLKKGNAIFINGKYILIISTAEANGEIVHGFYFHNDNGTLIKMNLSQKEDECDVDLGFDQESFD